MSSYAKKCGATSQNSVYDGSEYSDIKKSNLNQRNGKNYNLSSERSDYDDDQNDNSSYIYDDESEYYYYSYDYEEEYSSYEEDFQKMNIKSENRPKKYEFQFQEEQPTVQNAKSIIIPPIKSSFTERRSMSSDFRRGAPIPGYTISRRGNGMPLSITFPRKPSSPSPLRTEFPTQTKHRTIGRTQSFDFDISKPIRLTEIPDIDKIEVHDVDKIDSSILLGKKLDNVQDLFVSKQKKPLERNKVILPQNRRLTLDFSGIERYEKRADGTEIIEDRTGRRNSKFSTTGLKVELPNTKKQVEPKWSDEIEQENKSKRRSGIIHSSLTIQKDGHEYFGKENYSESEKSIRYDDINVEKPQRLEDNFMREVVEKDENGNEKKSKCISIPTFLEKKIEPITPISRYDSYPLTQEVVTNDMYPVDLLIRIRDQMTVKSAVPLKRMSGFKFLLELFDEMKNPEKYTMKAIKPTKIVTKADKKKKPDTDYFVPSSMNKGLVDSEEAAKTTLKQSFNRLTKDTLADVDNEIAALFINDQRISYAADIFFMKACNEQSFADLYAEFIAKSSSPVFREKVARMANTKFFEVLENPGNPESENDVEFAKGVSAFFGCLIKSSVIPEANGHHHVTKLFDLIDSTPLHTTHIEMLRSFILSVGAEFANKIDSNLWCKLDVAIAKKTLKGRMMFYINEVIETKNKYLSESETIRRPVEFESSDDNEIKAVRMYFSDYLQNEKSPSVAMSASDFLSASLKLIPEFPKDVAPLTHFVSEVLTVIPSNASDLLNVTKKVIKEFHDNKTIDVFSGLWAAVSDITMLMMLKGILELNDLREIHKAISNRRWDPIKDIKWYLYFNCDFSVPLQARGVDNEEILCALRMPETLNSQSIEIKYMSRIIAISIIRTILTNQKKHNMREIRQIPQIYRSVIKICLDKQRITTLDEVDAILSMKPFFNFTVEDFEDEFSITWK